MSTSRHASVNTYTMLNVSFQSIKPKIKIQFLGTAVLLFGQLELYKEGVGLLPISQPGPAHPQV